MGADVLVEDQELREARVRHARVVLAASARTHDCRMRRCCVVRALDRPPPPPARRAQSIATNGGGRDGMVRPPVRGGEGPRLRVATAIARGEPHLMVRMLCSMTRVWKSLWRSSSLSLSNEPSDVDESRNLRQGVRTVPRSLLLGLSSAPLPRTPHRASPVQRDWAQSVPPWMWASPGADVDKAYICFRTTHGAISAVRKYLVGRSNRIAITNRRAKCARGGCLRKATSTRAGACA